MKRLLCTFLTALSLIFFPLDSLAVSKPAPDDISIDAPSAILMEKETGEIIYEKDAYSRRSPASVTKLMTMLLAAEAVDSGQVSLDDSVTASAAAASMGGSQIWLEEGETMSFGEMLKCVTVVSANDCCVAIAEHLAGSEEAFVKRMNERAAALGLENTHFMCCSGLSDSDEHYSCAHDLAVIGRELLRHDLIRDYTTLWMDSIRGGEFTLSNTNKLIYHYDGATGLKTGFTSKAMHCLAASAMRDGVEYIAVILGAPSSAARFESAKTLLNYGFANYTLVSAESLCVLPPVKVQLGSLDCVEPMLSDGGKILIEKSSAAKLSCTPLLPEVLSAPVKAGQQIGSLQIKSGDTLLCELPVAASVDVEAQGYFDIVWKLLCSLLNPW